MMPAQPPLPTIWNLPFHPSAGSHASISICESSDGLSTAAIRQYAGRMIGGACGAPPRRPAAGVCGLAATGPPGGPCGPGGTNGPAGTICAEVMLVCGSANDFRFSHGAALVTAPSSIVAARLNIAGLQVEFAESVSLAVWTSSRRRPCRCGTLLASSLCDP